MGMKRSSCCCNAFVGAMPISQKRRFRIALTQGQGRKPRNLRPCHKPPAPRAQLPSESGDSRPLALGGGVAFLTAVLVNRVFFTPLDFLPPPQARGDLLAVSASAALILYGVGRADVQEKVREQVEIGGVHVESGYEGPEALANQLDWTARALFKGIPTVRSFALINDGKELCRYGRFRDEEVESEAPAGGIAANALESGKRAYLADLKVVPTAEVELAFLPENCQVSRVVCPVYAAPLRLLRTTELLTNACSLQSVVIQPVGSAGLMILGADKPRPFTGSDFGWLEAVSDRLADVISRTLG